MTDFPTVPRARLAALAAAAVVALGGCSGDRGELTYACTPDGEARPRYLLTKADRGDGLAVGAVQDLRDGRWLEAGRPVPLDANEITWLAGDAAFVVERGTGDLRVMDPARAGLRGRGACDRVSYVPPPGKGPGADPPRPDLGERP